MSGTLWICATPIGHLADASFRLIEILKGVDFLATEDTRVTQRLLAHYKIHVPQLIRLDALQESRKIDFVLSCLSEGKSVALVSDAGTPNICDPGYRLVAACLMAGYTVSPVPGPSALTAFLSVSGLPADRFAFGGFMPRKSSEIITVSQSYRALGCCVVFFESPKRMLATLEVLSHCSIDKIVVGKELTKTFQCIYAGGLQDVTQKVANSLVKGEWILALQFEPPLSQTAWQQWVQALFEQGVDAKTICLAAKAMGVAKNDVYEHLLHLKESSILSA